MVPRDLLYTDQHEWVRVETDQATVGITDHAQSALGDMTFVELPTVGQELVQGQEACAVESCKAAASVYAPADGKVTKINSYLEDDPGLMNSDCYGKGWLYKMQISDKGQLDKLMTPEQYEKFLAEQD